MGGKLFVYRIPAEMRREDEVAAEMTKKKFSFAFDIFIFQRLCE